MIGVLTPAYGRDYKNQKEVASDFAADKDFILNSIQGTTYTNRADLIRMGITGTIQVRYSKNRKTMMLKIQ